MNTSMVQRQPGGDDHDRTDTLPVPQIDDGDTGTLAMPVIPVDITDLAESLREREQLLEQANRQIAALEARVAQLTQQCEGLQQQCAALREAASVAAADPVRAAVPEPEPEPSPPVPPAASTAPALLRELAEVRRQNASLHEALCSWQAQQGVYAAMLAEAEAEAEAQARTPLQTASASAPAIATATASPDGTGWQARCDELVAALEAGRAGMAEREAEHAAHIAALHAELEALRAQPIAPPAAVAAPARPLQPIPVGNVLRVLVRQEHGTEVVYPLGRHTSIGRTPDNDIQVNATWVSRHHAVVLAGTDHCIVEDLNSTNGLLVNGHRVGRQVLHDGDTLTIGKTHFRYQQRT